LSEEDPYADNTIEEMEEMLEKGREYLKKRRLTARPPPVFARCRGCKSPLTEKQFLEWEACPYCGEKVAELFE
jgi:uncharacterized protein with PIN domain